MKRLLPFFSGNHFDHSLFIQAEGLHNFRSLSTWPAYGETACLNALMHMGIVSPIVPSRSNAINLIIVRGSR